MIQTVKIVLKHIKVYSIFKQQWFWHVILSNQTALKQICGMTNCVDPDQTAPSGSALFEYVMLSETLVYEILGHLP